MIKGKKEKERTVRVCCIGTYVVSHIHVSVRHQKPVIISFFYISDQAVITENIDKIFKVYTNKALNIYLG